MASGAGSSRNAGCLPGRRSQSSPYFHTYSPPAVFSSKSTLVLPDASHPTPQLWGSSGSRLTVSMWQSSLKWKRSRKPGVCASFARLGFQPLHSVCPRLGPWTKAFETLPDSAESDRRASSLFRCIQRRFEVLMMEFQQPLVTCREKRSNGNLSRWHIYSTVQMSLGIWGVQVRWHEILQSALVQQVFWVWPVCVLSATQFNSDLCDFSPQSRPVCSYFRNAPVKNWNFISRKCNEEDTNSANQTVWLMDDLERVPCSHKWLA